MHAKNLPQGVPAALRQQAILEHRRRAEARLGRADQAALQRFSKSGLSRFLR